MYLNRYVEKKNIIQKELHEGTRLNAECPWERKAEHHVGSSHCSNGLVFFRSSCCSEELTNCVTGTDASFQVKLISVEKGHVRSASAAPSRPLYHHGSLNIKFIKTSSFRLN